MEGGDDPEGNDPWGILTPSRNRFGFCQSLIFLLLRRRDEEHVACLSPKGKMKPGRRTVEVLSTPVKETLTLEVAGNLVKEVMEESSIPLSPIKMVSSKNSR